MASEQEVAELEKAVDIALAKLGVAENFGWWLAVFAALSTHLQWSSWLATAAAFLAAYFGSTHPYRRAEQAASEALNRATRRGNYSEQRPESVDSD